jgi:uncharacterized peroxidase-related enzyme
MAFGKMVEENEADPQIQPLYAKLAASRGGQVPNLFKAMGYDAAILGPAIEVADFVGAASSVSAKDKQIAYIAASRVNQCEYCQTRHTAAALKMGLREDQAQALSETANLLESSAFDATEKIIIALSEELTKTGHLSLATLQTASQSFSQTQLVEIIYVVASANMFNRIASGLHIELEAAFKIK